MNCKKCGAILAENDKFCKNCGEAVTSQMNSVVGQTPINLNNNGINQSMNNSNGLNPNYGQQPINNNQQSWSNSNNTPMYNNQTVNKNSGSGKYIAIGLVIVVVISAIIVAGKIVGNKFIGTKKNVGGGDETQVTSNSSYKVSFMGFSLEIPDNMIYEIQGNSLLIGDEDDTWAIGLGFLQGSYTKLKENKGQLQTSFTQEGCVSSAASVKTLGGIEYITLETSYSGEKSITAYAKINSMYVISIIAANNDNEYDYNIFDTIAPIVKSVQYTGSKINSIKGFTNFNMDVISELAK